MHFCGNNLIQKNYTDLLNTSKIWTYPQNMCTSKLEVEIWSIYSFKDANQALFSLKSVWIYSWVFEQTHRNKNT